MVHWWRLFPPKRFRVQSPLIGPGTAFKLGTTIIGAVHAVRLIQHLLVSEFWTTLLRSMSTSTDVIGHTPYTQHASTVSILSSPSPLLLPLTTSNYTYHYLTFENQICHRTSNLFFRFRQSSLAQLSMSWGDPLATRRNIPVNSYIFQCPSNGLCTLHYYASAVSQMLTTYLFCLALLASLSTPVFMSAYTISKILSQRDTKLTPTHIL